MNRTPVTSSQLVSVGHQPETQTLEVEFHPTKKQKEDGEPGSLYQYANVGTAFHAALIGAESVGSFFINQIKRRPDAFPFTKIR